MGTDEWASKEIMRQCLLVSMMGEEIPQYSIFFFIFFFSFIFYFFKEERERDDGKGKFSKD